LSRSSTSSLCLSTVALMTKSPSKGLRSCFRGESPQRTVMAVGVFSTTSKWSAMQVPLS
jgi:uncharacterized protein YbbK (DUF523 family)